VTPFSINAGQQGRHVVSLGGYFCSRPEKFWTFFWRFLSILWNSFSFFRHALLFVPTLSPLSSTRLPLTAFPPRSRALTTTGGD